MSKSKSLAIAYSMQRRNRSKMSKGDHKEHYGAIADAILDKKKEHEEMFADGGMVDDRDETLIDQEMEHGNILDDLDFDLLHDDHGIIDEEDILKDVKTKKRK